MSLNVNEVHYEDSKRLPVTYPILRSGVKLEGPKDGLFSNCLNCTFFNEGMELCNKFKAKPPARVIAFGCKDYLDCDEIPY